MRFCVLGSGSKGNCTYVEAGKGRFLIDAGFSGIEVERRLAAIGIDPITLSGIFVTHEHGDHIRAVPVLSRRYRLPVYATAGTFQGAGKGLEKIHQGVFLTAGTPHITEDAVIHPFSVSHDTLDPTGFLFLSENCSLGYCTDTGVVSRLIRHRLAGCNGLVLECNHDQQLLKTGPYPPHLKQRIKSKTGHLENREAIEFLRELAHEKLEHVVLAHISETNNCYNIVSSLLEDGEETEEERRIFGNGCRVTLALQDQVGELVQLGGNEKSK